MKRYFKVKARAGHVGKNNYTEISLFIASETKKDAALKARWTPRVKHHDKRAIIDVIEITYEDYNVGILKNLENPYFKVKNIQEQRAVCNEIEIMRYEILQNHKIGKSERKSLKERNLPKYLKYCGYYDTTECLQELYVA